MDMKYYDLKSLLPVTQTERCKGRDKFTYQGCILLFLFLDKIDYKNNHIDFFLNSTSSFQVIYSLKKN